MMEGSGETGQESGGRRVTSRGRRDRRGKRGDGGDNEACERLREEVNEKRKGQWEVMTERGFRETRGVRGRGGEGGMAIRGRRETGGGDIAG